MGSQRGETKAITSLVGRCYARDDCSITCAPAENGGIDVRTTADILLFEDFCLDRCRGGLFRQLDGGVSEPLVIGSRALELLCILIDRRGELVAKGELMDAVWPETVVEENNLAVQISALRRLLDHGRSEGSCIQTIPGRGYRFVAAVTRVEPAAPLTPDPNFSAGRGGPVAATGQPIGPGPDGPGGISPVRISRARHRLWGGVVATIAGAVVLVAAAGAWNWHSLWPGEARRAPRLSIVVLPFTNLSDDREQQYFADGVTEDLTTDLSRIADSFVISRNTAFTYKDKPINAKQIGRELGVRYVLEGAVQRSATQVRVNAQLIDAETDAHVWAERFERDISDLFALQNEITGRIAIALNFALIGAEAARPTVSPDVLDFILRGRAAALKPPSRENRAERIGFYERALALDPQSVEAQSLLALTLTGRVFDGMSTSAADDIERAEGLVGKALASSPRSLLSRVAKGDLLRALNRCEEAIPEYEMVLASNPNAVGVLGALGQCKLYTGSIEETIPLAEQAIRRSPRDPLIFFWYLQIGRAHLLQSRTDEAILWLEKARSANPAHPSVHSLLASAYGLASRTERAASELAEARRLSGEPDRYSSIARLSRGYFGVPKVRALYEATYFVGLRKAGVPEE